MPYLVAIAFPSTAHPEPIRGFVIHDSLSHTHKALIDQRCCLHAGSAGRPQLEPATASWERGPLAATLY